MIQSNNSNSKFTRQQRLLKHKQTSQQRLQSDGFILVMIRYIENIDISFLISIYCIVSYHQKNIEFFDIS